MRFHWPTAWPREVPAAGLSNFSLAAKEMSRFEKSVCSSNILSSWPRSTVCAKVCHSRLGMLSTCAPCTVLRYHSDTMSCSGLYPFMSAGLFTCSSSSSSSLTAPSRADSDTTAAAAAAASMLVISRPRASPASPASYAASCAAGCTAAGCARSLFCMRTPSTPSPSPSSPSSASALR